MATGLAVADNPRVTTDGEIISPYPSKSTTSPKDIEKLKGNNF